MEVPWTDTLPTRIREACKPGRILSGRGRHPVSYRYRINPVKRVRLLRLHVCILCFYSSDFCSRFYRADCVWVDDRIFVSQVVRFYFYILSNRSQQRRRRRPAPICFLNVFPAGTEPVNFSRILERFDRVNENNDTRYNEFGV